MTKPFWIASLITGLSFIIAPFAQAALIGSADYSLENLLGGGDTSYALRNVNLTGQTDLNTSINSNTTSILRRGAFAYYTDENGLQKRTIGSSVTTTLIEQADLEQMAAQGSTLIISRGQHSFAYDVVKQETAVFKPRINSIVGADLALNGTKAVIIGKNFFGKQKIFVTQSSLNRVRAYNLPGGSSMCFYAAVSPKAERAALLCSLTATGDVAVFTMDLTGQTIGKYHRKTTSTFAPQALEWLSERRLVVGGFDTTQNSITRFRVKEYVINSRNSITKVRNLAVNDQAYNPYPETTLGTAIQLVRYSSHAFYVTYNYFGTDSNEETLVYSTSIGHFDVLTKANRMLLQDGTFSLFTEAPDPINGIDNAF